MRVLGLAADGSFAVLETDGRAIEAFGPAGRRFELAELGEIDLVGLQEGDPEEFAATWGLPVATGFGAFGVAKAVYYRARARLLGLERPTAVIDGDQVILIEENGLLISGADPRQARAVVQAKELGPFVDAEAVAYLAARCWNGFPIQFPGTTGAPYPMTTGRIVRPQ
ncbi:MAG: hypothetical protein ACM3W4_10620 [Ignavibacteriales bacterium]